jgi:hypothetical protein
MNKSNAARKPEKISKRGGSRPGAGRKPGSPNKARMDHLYQPCCEALAQALDGAIPLQFIFAMWCLDAPLEASRAALDMSHDAFAAKYGGAIAVFTARQRAGLLAEEKIHNGRKTNSRA